MFLARKPCIRNSHVIHRRSEIVSKSKKRELLSQEEHQKLLFYVKSRAKSARERGMTRTIADELIVQLLSRAGLRANEIRTSNWECPKVLDDMSRRNRTLNVRLIFGKTNWVPSTQLSRRLQTISVGCTSCRAVIARQSNLSVRLMRTGDISSGMSTPAQTPILSNRIPKNVKY